MNAEDKIFEKLDTMQNDISAIKTDVEVLKNREQPSAPCRKVIDQKYNELSNKIIGVNGGLGHTINDIRETVNKKVGYKFFWTVIISSGSVIISAVWKIIDIALK